MSGEKEAPAAVPEAPQRRRRVRLQVTVNERTADRVGWLGQKLDTSQGRVVDRLVEAAYQAYRSGEMRCIVGQDCPVHRKDLPEVW